LEIEHIELQQRLVLLAKHLKLDVAAPAARPPPELLTTIGPDFDRHHLALGHQGTAGSDPALGERGERRPGQTREALCARSAPMLRLHLKEAEALGHKIGV
jgi:hypothetical protein